MLVVTSATPKCRMWTTPVYDPCFYEHLQSIRLLFWGDVLEERPFHPSSTESPGILPVK
ncbi:MAG: hypothetical protein JWO13_1476 [Acidobacteriales bacterium]|nr:hypothetical protein [Terriglobales bacterium]